MGACGDWLPVYGASGMHDLYIGDEAVVDVRRFSLDGKQNKSLRQSVGRVRKAGLPRRVLRPAQLEPELEQPSSATLMTESRRGDVERGFSMTLGRAFEPDDRGLAARGRVRRRRPARPAFCQYVPARAISGWSLDLMRRSSEATDVPTGSPSSSSSRRSSTSAREGYVGLALNFATFRAVLASEAGDRLVHRVREVVPRAGERLDADRVAVDVQREVPARVAPALRVLRLARAPAERRRSRSRGPSRSWRSR